MFVTTSKGILCLCIFYAYARTLRGENWARIYFRDWLKCNFWHGFEIDLTVNVFNLAS